MPGGLGGVRSAMTGPCPDVRFGHRCASLGPDGVGETGGQRPATKPGSTILVARGHKCPHGATLHQRLHRSCLQQRLRVCRLGLRISAIVDGETTSSKVRRRGAQAPSWNVAQPSTISLKRHLPRVVPQPVLGLS